MKKPKQLKIGQKLKISFPVLIGAISALLIIGVAGTSWALVGNNDNDDTAIKTNPKTNNIQSVDESSSIDVGNEENLNSNNVNSEPAAPVQEDTGTGNTGSEAVAVSDEQDTGNETNSGNSEDSVSNKENNKNEDNSEGDAPGSLEEKYVDTYPSELADIPMNSEIDNWGMYNRQSVSYTAWKVNEKYGNMPDWGFGSPNGDALNWPTHADNDNIPTGNKPRPHSVAVSLSGPNGFTAWVEDIDGDTFTMSSYNQNQAGEYAVHENVPVSHFDTYIYFSDME